MTYVLRQVSARIRTLRPRISEPYSLEGARSQGPYEACACQNCLRSLTSPASAAAAPRCKSIWLAMFKRLASAAAFSSCNLCTYAPCSVSRMYTKDRNTDTQSPCYC